MNYTDVVYAIGDGLLWTCDIIFDHVGNIFNITALLVGFVGAFYWLRLQAKYQKEDKAKGVRY
ncbi:MAG: hypothetical protein H3C31_02020 [Brumimicrobium sp.]|nr:hypothetical protein [Brumimicrobium sp.]MCO5269687.1 hypothetical protein [Brumimicrobium sp.]